MDRVRFKICSVIVSALWARLVRCSKETKQGAKQRNTHCSSASARAVGIPGDPVRLWRFLTSALHYCTSSELSVGTWKWFPSNSEPIAIAKRLDRWVSRWIFDSPFSFISSFSTYFVSAFSFFFSLFYFVAIFSPVLPERRQPWQSKSSRNAVTSSIIKELQRSNSVFPTNNC